MTSIVKFIQQMQNLGIVLWNEDGILKFNAPKNVMTDEIRTKLKSRKEEIIMFLNNDEGAQMPAIAACEKKGAVPLSALQEQLWILEHEDNIGATYNMMKAFHINGALDIPLFIGSIEKVIDRHEILRTVFPAENGIPEQKIIKISNLTKVIDVTNKDIKEVHKLIDNKIAERLDLVDGPLIKSILFKLGEEAYIYLVIMHHIVSDGWSLKLFFHEISGYYSKRMDKANPEHGVIQYSDYSIWQKENITKEYLKPHIEFWKHVLDDAPEQLQLFYDKSAKKMKSYNGAVYHFEIDENLVMEINKANEKWKASSYMIILAGYYILLYLSSGQTDIVVGTPLGNRNQEEIKDLIGYFVNTLPLRVNMDETASLLHIVNQVKTTVLESFEHQDIPFKSIVEEVKPNRTNQFQPIFQTMFSMLNDQNIHFKLENAVTEEIKISNATAKFDLNLSIETVNKKFEGALEYNTDLFEQATIEKLSNLYINIIEILISSPEMKLSELKKELNSFLLSENKQRVNNDETLYSKSKIAIQVIALFKNILGMDELPLKSSYFGAGGNSLQIIEIIFEIELKYKINITVEDFYESKTIEDLIKKVEIAILEKEMISSSDTISGMPIENIPKNSEILDEVIGMMVELLEETNIKPEDNFFDLGGNSLMLIQLIAKIDSTFQVALSISDFLELQKISDLADRISVHTGKKGEAYIEDCDVKEDAKDIFSIKKKEFPLSYSQEQLWFLEQFKDIGNSYSIYNFFDLEGSLELGNLENSLNEIIKRHDILRTVFVNRNGTPKQIIHPYQQYKLRVISLEDFDEADKKPRLNELLKEEINKKFNLEEPYLFRAVLFRMSDQKNCLLFNIHHIICDGWSMDIIFNEWSSYYNFYTRKEFGIIPAPEIQFNEYVEWQRDFLQSEHAKKGINYWKKILENVPNEMQLNYDNPKGLIQTYNGDIAAFKVNHDFSKKIDEFSQINKMLPLTILISAYVILLCQNSNQNDIIIALPAANRTLEETQKVVGYMVNTLPLRFQVRENMTKADFLKTNNISLLKGIENQMIPLGVIISEIDLKREHNNAPLLQCLFNMESDFGEDLNFYGLNAKKEELANYTTKFDLSLSARSTSAGYNFDIEYNSDLFHLDTIQRMCNDYVEILKWLVISPDDELIKNKVMIYPNEKVRTLSLPDTNKRIHELFEVQAARYPTRQAVACEDESLTYRELNEKSNQIAHFLRSKKISNNSLVGVYTERSVSTIVSILGILKAGGAYVPIDPAYPIERINFIIEDAQIEIMLGTVKNLDQYDFKGVTSININSELSYSKENPETVNHIMDLMYVIYTSGSTGKPKGVMVMHSNLLALLNGFEKVAAAPSPLAGMSICPFGFDVSVWEIFSNLCYGGTLHIITQKLYTIPKDLVQYICSNYITSGYIPPALLPYIIDELERGNDTLPIRRLLVGVEPIKAEILLRYMELSKDIQIINGYGPTETTICATLFNFKGGMEKSRIIPIGNAIDKYNIYLVDKNMNVVENGEEGEILISGAGVAKGYLNQPELTAEKFVDNLFDTDSDHKILYRTGDIGRYSEDGYIEFKGRMDDQIKIRGHRIELGEIRSKLLTFPGVKDVAVIVKGDSDMNKKIIAYYCADPDVSLEQLKHHINNWLPDYMLPHKFVKMNEIPRNQNGKVDKDQLLK